ncbi:peptide chain release factor N(5)-glutamine methyltransferase [Pedobacter namyangjuensis]|uniref:peptide chain release factor N(5)-glutamine methyltransferase n=1 Tax=Pedobacter namyangjuensis TaxID=600626 RepID=UPI000DE4FE94|nr:peptide chain release factor N(5)-glutamine methyltransferase [Pedobacter namyangjuensis]
MKLLELSDYFKQSLIDLYDEDEAQSIFFITIDSLLNYNRSAFLVNKQRLVTDAEFAAFENVISSLKSGKPIQYILGEAYFYGLKFKVNQAVLIPRPETEELVEWILDEIDNSLEINILDIGTGSGCIAIALKRNQPLANVYALDIAIDTIATAKENALLNNAEISFITDDILNLKTSFDKKINIIVSNPPYIKEDEKQAMHQNVLANEPHRALFVTNENPLIFYNAIAEFAMENLADHGLLFFEINEYLGKETVSLLKHKGFNNIELRKDMQGKDRMVKASL